MTPRYRQGWNDRVTGAGGDYGKVYIGGDGKTLIANAVEARTWPFEDRAEYVRGWADASAKILALVLDEASPPCAACGGPGFINDSTAAYGISKCPACRAGTEARTDGL